MEAAYLVSTSSTSVGGRLGESFVNLCCLLDGLIVDVWG